MSLRKQTPEVEGNWLYQMQEENTCVFSKLVFLGVNAPEWEECDEAFKEQWEKEHPVEQPT